MGPTMAGAMRSVLLSKSQFGLLKPIECMRTFQRASCASLTEKCDMSHFSRVSNFGGMRRSVMPVLESTIPGTRNAHSHQGSHIVCSASASSAQEGDSNEGGGWLKNFLFWIGRWIASFLVIAAAFVAALPSILSNSVGLGTMTTIANLFIPGAVQVNDAKLGWNKPVYVKGVKLKESGKSDVAVAEVNQISTTQTLWQVASGKDFDMVVNGPVINAGPDANGEIPLVRYAQQAGIIKKSKGTAKSEIDEVPITKIVQLSGEVRKGGTNIFVTDGQLYVNEEISLAIGKQLHWLIAQGNETVASVSDELGADVEWMKASWKPRGGKAISLSVDAPNLGAEVKGWQSGSGLTLSKPASAWFQFTPVFAREGLSRINPLMGESVKIPKGTKVQVEIDSSDMRLPSKVTRIHLEPIKLTVESGPLANGLLDLLDVNEKGLSQDSPLEAWMSSVDCEIVNNDVIKVKRCDMLLGPAKKGLHVVVWGECHTSSKAMKMSMGVPASALRRAGYQVADDYVLPIPLKGTVDQPVVDWAAASSDLTKLTLERVGGMITGEQGTLAGFMRNTLFDAARRTKASRADVPSLTAPLPWE